MKKVTGCGGGAPWLNLTDAGQNQVTRGQQKITSLDVTLTTHCPAALYAVHNEEKNA
jgi:hypothetical protein